MRNVTLAGGYTHVTCPSRPRPAESPAMRAWIDAYALPRGQSRRRPVRATPITSSGPPTCGTAQEITGCLRPSASSARSARSRPPEAVAAMRARGETPPVGIIPRFAPSSPARPAGLPGRRGGSRRESHPIHVNPDHGGAACRKGRARDGRRARHRPRHRAEARAPRAATSPSTTTTAPTKREALCAEIRALGRRAVRDPGERRHPRQRRRDVRRVRQALRSRRHPRQQRGQRRAEADGRDDAQALALVHGDQRACAQPPRAACAAADARTAAAIIAMSSLGAHAGDAGLRLHRRVEGGAGGAGARRSRRSSGRAASASTS